MRKCIFYLTIIFCNFAFGETAISYGLPSLTAETKTPGLNLRLAWKLPSTEIATVPEWNPPAWGVSLNTKDFSPAPFIFKAGQVSLSGPISKLKTPTISSTASPFTSTVASVSTPNVAMPSASSWQKPIALSATFDYCSSKLLLRRLNLTHYVNTDGLEAFSFMTKIQPAKKLDLSLSGATGFFATENTSTSWFSSTELFNSYVQIPAVLQLSISSPYFKTRETLCAFKSFDQENYYTFSTENTFSLGDFNLNLAAFSASSAYIFTASSSQIKTLFQFKINPQYSFYLPYHLCRIRYGNTFFLEEKLTSEGPETILKIAQGLEVKTKKSCETFTFSVTDLHLGNSLYALRTNYNPRPTHEIWEEASYTATAKFSSQFKSQKNATVSITLNPDSGKMSCKISGKIQLPTHFPKYLNISSSLVTKNLQFTSYSFSAGTGFILKTKAVTINATASLSFNLKN